MHRTICTHDVCAAPPPLTTSDHPSVKRLMVHGPRLPKPKPNPGVCAQPTVDSLLSPWRARTRARYAGRAPRRCGEEARTAPAAVCATRAACARPPAYPRRPRPRRAQPRRRTSRPCRASAPALSPRRLQTNTSTGCNTTLAPIRRALLCRACVARLCRRRQQSRRPLWVALEIVCLRKKQRERKNVTKRDGRQLSSKRGRISPPAFGRLVLLLPRILRKERQ